MFGSFRTLLALGVVISHLGSASYMGTYAVFGFYALSGYLMTLIMHETYGYTRAGLGRYALNRALRIYPLYLAAAVISLLLIAFMGENITRAYHDAIGYPKTIGEVVGNASLVLLVSTDTRLVPPAWALTVELCYYALIALGASRTAPITFIWLAASTLYTIYLVTGGASFSYRYYTIAAASLPFALGASLYHFGRAGRSKGFLKRIAGDRALALLLLLLAGNYAIAGQTTLLTPGGGHFYLNLLLMALTIANLSQRRASTMDKRIGDLSYPIYLTHFQCGLIALALAPGAFDRGDTLFVAASLPIVLVVAWGLSVAIEGPIERIRSWVKRRADARL